MRAIKLVVLCGIAVVLTIAAAFSAATPTQVPSPIRDLGITRTYGVSAQIFDAVVDLKDLQKGVGHFLLNTVAECRRRARAMGKSAPSIAGMSGNWLEDGLLIALKEKQLTPAYGQAEFTAVPNAFNDLMLFSKEHGPIILSCKTSLRERYKQADLEAFSPPCPLSGGREVSAAARCLDIAPLNCYNMSGRHGRARWGVAKR
ncbi:MAG: hypothetical protein NZT92_07105 [Abditibacteriales bacterium]|nr:hypothetical protein [Abditibacteriales bacterium]MDW8365721.1 hypothetical protein [Abditibacteriales bacterium]